MKCKYCGTINDEDALFCKKCGNNFIEEVNSITRKKENKPKTKIKTKTKVKKVKQKVKSNNRNREKSNNHGFLIFILVIFIALLVGISAILGYHIYDEEKNIEVPNLYNLTYEDARIILAKKNLKITKIDKEVNDDTKDNIVINQNKKIGNKVSKNTTIKVTVGKYVYRLDNFIDMKKDLAINTLKHNNITYKIVEKEVTDENKNDIVIEQYPKSNKKLNNGDTVTLTIGKYKKQESNISEEAKDSVTEDDMDDSSLEE